MDATNRHDRVVFLDRDGVINRAPPKGSWVLRWEEFRFADGALEALRRLAEQGFTVVVVTNQSCVGRGLVPLSDVEAMNAGMAEAVAAAGGKLAGVYLCPHTSGEGCSCRKPKPGLIDRAARELGLRPERAFLVGDADRDIETGRARGCTTVFVTSGEGGDGAGLLADHRVSSLAEAVGLILRLTGGEGPATS
jgi:D-glycero-D-manno-heptose 1,7-bisphosphate phosphatase